MRYVLILFILLSFLSDFRNTVSAQPAATAPVKSFRMFNNLFENNPDMTADGILPITGASPIGYVNGKPDLETARYDARLAAGIKMNPATRQPLRDSRGRLLLLHAPQPLIIDQEGAIDITTVAGRNDMLQAIAAIRDEWSKYPDHPEFKTEQFGIFGPIPAALPNLIQLDDPAVLDKLNADYDADAALIQALDFLCPVFYLDTTDSHDFTGRMSLLTRFARQSHKPLYAYVWPEYFEQVQEVPMNELIPKDQWQAILDEARNENDGVILWGGEHRYDPNLPWARITKNYLTQKPLPSPSPPTNFQVDPIGLHLSWQGVDSTSRVRVERTIDAGKHWRPLAGTDLGATHFDDPEYLTSSGFTPQYRIQAYNPSPLRIMLTARSSIPLAMRSPSIAESGTTPFIPIPIANTSAWPISSPAIGSNSKIWPSAKTPITSIFSGGPNPISTSGSIAKSIPTVRLIFLTPPKSARSVAAACINPAAIPPSLPASKSAPVSVPGGPNVTHDVFLVSTDGVVFLMWAKFGGANDPSAPPRHFSAAGQGGKILLSWFDQSEDETGFQIERSTDLGMTWTKLPDIPPINPPHPDESNSLHTFTIPALDDAMYTYRISSLHGAGVAPDIFTDVATGSSKLRPFAIAFPAKAYDRAVGVHVDTRYPDSLFHTELGQASTHNSEKIQKYSWMKYSADFATDADRITLNLSTESLIPPDQTISFYLDRLAPDHKLASWNPH